MAKYPLITKDELIAETEMAKQNAQNKIDQYQRLVNMYDTELNKLKNDDNSSINQT